VARSKKSKKQKSKKSKQKPRKKMSVASASTPSVGTLFDHPKEYAGESRSVAGSVAGSVAPSTVESAVERALELATQQVLSDNVGHVVIGHVNDDDGDDSGGQRLTAPLSPAFSAVLVDKVLHGHGNNNNNDDSGSCDNYDSRSDAADSVASSTTKDLFDQLWSHMGVLTSSTSKEISVLSTSVLALAQEVRKLQKNADPSLGGGDDDNDEDDTVSLAPSAPASAVGSTSGAASSQAQNDEGDDDDAEVAAAAVSNDDVASFFSEWEDAETNPRLERDRLSAKRRQQGAESPKFFDPEDDFPTDLAHLR
jgi:hypothetical protein